jgi:hypothetical protein
MCNIMWVRSNTWHYGNAMPTTLSFCCREAIAFLLPLSRRHEVTGHKSWSQQFLWRKSGWSRKGLSNKRGLLELRVAQRLNEAGATNEQAVFFQVICPRNLQNETTFSSPISSTALKWMFRQSWQHMLSNLMPVEIYPGTNPSRA